MQRCADHALRRRSFWRQPIRPLPPLRGYEPGHEVVDLCRLTPETESASCGVDGLEIAIDFGAVLDAVDADESLRGIDPVEDAPVADTEFAQARKFVRHSDETPVNDGGGVFREPGNFAFDAGADGGVERGQLSVSLRTYFDSIGHERWRGVQVVNLPARSSCRA